MLRRTALQAIALAGALAITLVSGCGGGKDDAQKKVIGYSMLTSNNQFFNVIGETMQAAAKDKGFEVQLLSADEDVNKQKKQIEDFITQGVSAIVLNPADSKAIGPAIQKANEAGIPVFTNDIGCTAEGAKVVTHVATDNKHGGRLAGEATVTLLKGEGKCAVLDYPKVESCQLRVAGFKEVIEEHNKKGGGQVEIVKILPGGADRAPSRTATQAILSSNPDVGVIFCINDPSALGAIAALKEANRLGEIQVVGFDGAPEGKRAVANGESYATPTQFPRKMATTTIEVISRYFAGEKVESEILIPPTLYTKADADANPAGVSEW